MLLPFFLSKSVLLMNPTIADLLTNSSLFILSATMSLVNLLKSTVVIYLLSMSDIFQS